MAPKEIACVLVTVHRFWYHSRGAQAEFCSSPRVPQPRRPSHISCELSILCSAV